MLSLATQQQTYARGLAELTSLAGTVLRLLLASELVVEHLRHNALTVSC